VSTARLDVDLESIGAICARYGVARLEVFGSVSRGDARADSDVDLLYDLVPGARLGWEIEDLSDELAAAFGRPVDLVSRSAIHDRLRLRVLAEARVLFSA
jgi:predicted nucleotidyltransferase